MRASRSTRAAARAAVSTSSRCARRFGCSGICPWTGCRQAQSGNCSKLSAAGAHSSSVAVTVTRLIEQHFGQSGAWSLGLEEEIMILDAETYALAPRVKALVDWAEGRS